MKKIIISFCFSIFFMYEAHADDRQVIKIPAEIKTMFLEEMRTHLDNLNEITYAISAGDFDGASYVAKNKMGFGHSMREIMMEKGMPEEEIDAMIRKMQKLHGDVGGHGMGKGKGMGRAKGIGRFMPEEVRLMGRSFHEAAENFAKVAKNVGDNPTVKDYQRVFSALSEVVDVCSACHATFRVE